MLAERLNKAWAAKRGSNAIDAAMQFTEEGLVLGAGTVLIEAGAIGEISNDKANEARLCALLAAAHLRRPTGESLAHLRKAAERRREGEGALAAMHLALSRLDRLERPEADAYRLFLADGLMKAGIASNAIVGAIEGGDPGFNRLQKYSADQPRVPAGSGRTSGQWTSGDEGSPVGGPTQPDPNNLVAAPQRIESVRACEIAGADCLSAAIEASANDPPGDKRRFVDKTNCKEATLACDALSWATEDLPLPLSGGVHMGGLF